MQKNRFFFQMLFASVLMCVLFMSASLPVSAASHTSTHQTQTQALIGMVPCSYSNKVLLVTDGGSSICYTGSGEVNMNDQYIEHIVSDHWSGFASIRYNGMVNTALFCDGETRVLAQGVEMQFIYLSPTRESWCS